MAKNRRKRRKQSARSLDVEELVDLVGALNGMRNGGHSVPALDPTINVKDQLGAAISGLRTEAELTSKYEEKIRDLDRKAQERLDAERQRADKARQDAEAGRLDSRITDVVRSADLSTERLTNAATILANTVATTADTAQKALVAAADVQREMVGQVRDTVTALQGVVTTFIATGGGERSAKTEQMTETRWTERQRSQRQEWLTGLWVGVAIFAAGLLAKALHII